MNFQDSSTQAQHFGKFECSTQVKNRNAHVAPFNFVLWSATTILPSWLSLTCQTILKAVLPTLRPGVSGFVPIVRVELLRLRRLP